jgi:heme/copper-type cytochrome/quinol oxidase subunit 4
VNTTLFGLETKFMNAYGTPLHLSSNSREMLDTMKSLFVTLFVLPVVIYGIVLNYKDQLNVGFLIALSKSYSNIVFYMFVMLLAIVILGLSCWQLSLANRFSKLKNKDLLK